MSHLIWPVVTENLAEQLSAAQSGIVHPSQLLPYLPLSLIEQTLDQLCDSDRVEKQTSNGLAADADLYKAELDAKGTLLEKEASAEGEFLKATALNTPGGENFVAFGIIQQLNLGEVVVSTQNNDFLYVETVIKKVGATA